MWVRNLGSLPQKIWGPKTSKFRISRFDREISGWEQDIVDRKTALKTAITPLRVYQIWWTLVQKRRKIVPVNHFDPLNRLFRTLISQLISQGLRGVDFAVGRGWPTLANAHLTGDGSAPNNFLTPEIWKLAKNLVYIRQYHRDLLGKLHQTFVLDVSP